LNVKQKKQYTSKFSADSFSVSQLRNLIIFDNCTRTPLSYSNLLQKIMAGEEDANADRHTQW